MTNDTIDQDARVTRAAVVRLPRHAAVRVDLDAARMRIMRTLFLGAHSRVAERISAHSRVAERISAHSRVAERRGIRHEMTADKPSRPLGVASTHRWTAQPAP